MMRKGLLAVVAIAAIGCSGVAPRTAVSGEPTSPAVGYDIHVQAPHMMADGTTGGPYHHYCKGISDKILQCLLFESTDPKAPLVGIEYFVAKDRSGSQGGGNCSRDRRCDLSLMAAWAGIPGRHREFPPVPRAQVPWVFR